MKSEGIIEQIKIPCRKCNGTGMVEVYSFQKAVKDKFPMVKRKQCFELYKKGLSLRAVGKAMGIKSAQTVKYFIITYLEMYDSNSTKTTRRDGKGSIL